MANNIGYSFKIEYKDSTSEKEKWLQFQIQDGVILSSDKQSGYTASISPKELKLNASYGTKRADGHKRSADIIFRQNDTNNTKTITITQNTDQSISAHPVGTPSWNPNKTPINIFAANNFNFSNIIPYSGGTAYIKAQCVQLLEQKWVETDKYGNQREYFLPLPSENANVLNYTDVSVFTSNYNDNVRFENIEDESGQFIKVTIVQNPTIKSRQIIIYANDKTNNIKGESPSITQEGTPTTFKFVISTNIEGSIAIFKDFQGNSKEIEANHESNGQYKGFYYAEYEINSTVEPKLYGYVINKNCTYSNGTLKLFNEYNNLTTVGGIYTWANANADGDTLKVTGLYVGSKYGYKSKYTETNPLILSENGADNYIELTRDVDTVSSTTISANVKEGNPSINPLSDSIIEITVPKINNTDTTDENKTDTTDENKTDTNNTIKSVSSSVEIYSTLDTQAKQLLKIKQSIE
jgi:hypothetical protein